jgi:hypothetical protein
MDSYPINSELYEEEEDVAHITDGGGDTTWIDEDEYPKYEYSEDKPKKTKVPEEPDWMELNEEEPEVRGGRPIKPAVLVGFRYWPKQGKPIYYISEQHPLYEHALENPPTNSAPEELVTCGFIEEIGGSGDKEHWLTTNHYNAEMDCWGKVMFRGKDCDNFFFRQDYEEPVVEKSGVVGEDIEVPELMK